MNRPGNYIEVELKVELRASIISFHFAFARYIKKSFIAKKKQISKNGGAISSHRIPTFGL